MKKIAALLLALILCFSMMAAMAETPETEPVNENTLQFAWDSVVKFANDAGMSVQEWTEGAAKNIESVFNDMMTQVNGWFTDVNTFFNESGANISEEVTNAWDTLMSAVSDAGAWTQEQINSATATLTEWLNQSGTAIEQGTRDAVNGIISLFNGGQQPAAN